ncbi:hypothetical protein AURDEDRAFT_153531 [Auricularia subglabra TFB-10046 SS5]|nr:hypothetical protein AURDEDRAFT_153531 [Auricularia subglabra TFB-10046 SS5]
MRLTLAFNALLLSYLSGSAHGQLVAWHKGMFCKNGITNTDTPNAQYPVVSLWNLATNDWFLHGSCRNFPPQDGDFLKIPANGEFTVEIAANRAFTTLSYNGQKTTDWPDGAVHPDGWSTNMTDAKYPPTSAGCLSAPNIHAHGEADAAGTAFAIAYTSDISTVQLSDFTVFTVAPNTPYKRLATYEVPNLPACPAGGCLCAWAWIPNHCGQASALHCDNMYQNAYRCQVTGADPGAPAVGTPQPAAWCESDPDKCVSGPKQMTIAFQADGNNFVSPGGWQKDNTRPSPGYNMKMGFQPGAQTDIFVAPAPDTTSTAYMEGSTCAASVAVTTTAIATATAYASCPSDEDFTTTVTVTVTPTATQDADAQTERRRRRQWDSESAHENKSHGHPNAHRRGWASFFHASIF